MCCELICFQLTWDMDKQNDKRDACYIFYNLFIDNSSQLGNEMVESN